MPRRGIDGTASMSCAAIEHGLQSVNSAMAEWGGVGTGVTVGWHWIDWLGARLWLDGIYSPEPPLFVVDQTTFVHQPSSFTARAALGIEATF